MYRAAGELPGGSSSSGPSIGPEEVAFEEVLQLGPDLERGDLWRRHDGFSSA